MLNAAENTSESEFSLVFFLFGLVHICFSSCCSCSRLFPSQVVVFSGTLRRQGNFSIHFFPDPRCFLSTSLIEDNFDFKLGGVDRFQKKNLLKKICCSTFLTM
ncbi:hypothetical protein Dimus_039316 [Dionaea muscipula]